MDIDQLRDHCLDFKGAHEGIKWEHLCFMVAEKMFCITNFEEDGFISFKVSPEDLAELTERNATIKVPYFSQGHWVAVKKGGVLKNAEMKEYLHKSYELIKGKLTKKKQREIDEL